MVNKPLDLKLMFKRRRCLENSRTDLKTCDSALANKNLNLSKQLQNSVIESDLSNMDWNGYILYMEGLYDKNNYNLLESLVCKFTDNIVPTVENVQKLIDTVREANIGDINKNKIIEAANCYKTIDRINNNHLKLSKRFPIYEAFCNRNKSTSDRIYSVCKFIDTYKTSPYIKFNIALEEVSYLNFYNSEISKINESDTVKYILNYFLLREDNTSQDISKYKKAIMESKIISNDPSSDIKYFIEDSKSILEGYIPDNFENDYIGWKLQPNKSIKGLVEIANKYNDTADKVFTIISTIREFCKINDMDCPRKIYRVPFTEYTYNFDEIKSIYDGLKMYVESCSNNADKNVLSEFKVFSEALYDSIYENELLREDDENDIKKYTSDKTEELFDSKSIGKLKLNSLIKDAKIISGFLSKSKKIMQDNGIYENTEYLVNVKEDSIKNYVGEDAHMSVPIRSYSISDKNIIKENVFNTVKSIQKCSNNILYNSDYCLEAFINDNSIDFNLRSKFKVALSLDEESTAEFPDNVMKSIVDLHDTIDCCDDDYTDNAMGCMDTLNSKKFAGDVTKEQFNLLNDMTITIFGNNSILEQLVENARLEENNDYAKIKESYVYSSSIDQAPLNIKYHPKAFSLLSEAINADGAMDAIGKISNDINLAWRAFKNKASKLSAKSQEASRDLDMNFNHFVKSIQSYTKSDTREQIVRGEVVPSLSKMLKISLVLAGTGLLSGGLFVPAMLAATGLVLKRHATIKEVGFIIDELDIELKVLDKEISRAESDGSSKRYRELLTVQKKIQRERQKILYKYALKGKKFNPVSNASSGD